MLNKHLMQVGTDFGFGTKLSKLKVTSIWANINPKGSSNVVHSYQSPCGMPSLLVLNGYHYT